MTSHLTKQLSLYCGCCNAATGFFSLFFPHFHFITPVFLDHLPNNNLFVSGFDIRGMELRQDEIKSKDQQVKNGSSTDIEKREKHDMIALKIALQKVSM